MAVDGVVPIETFELSNNANGTGTVGSPMLAIPAPCGTTTVDRFPNPWCVDIAAPVRDIC